MPRGIYPRTEYHRKINSEGHKGLIPWNKGKKCPWAKPPHFKGEKSSHWIDGRSLEPGYKTKLNRLWREKNREHSRLLKRKRRILKRKNGFLSIQVIQQVYECNINNFGTLTCVYCFTPIVFGNDTLDHVIPISKGGNHSFNNLVIACKICNCIKKDRLIGEL